MLRWNEASDHPDLPLTSHLNMDCPEIVCHLKGKDKELISVSCNYVEERSNLFVTIRCYLVLWISFFLLSITFIFLVSTFAPGFPNPFVFSPSFFCRRRYFTVEIDFFLHSFCDKESRDYGDGTLALSFYGWRFTRRFPLKYLH